MNYSMTAISHSTISTQTVVVNFMDIVAAFVCPVFSKYSMHTYSEIINAIPSNCIIGLEEWPLQHHT